MREAEDITSLWRSQSFTETQRCRTQCYVPQVRRPKTRGARSGEPSLQDDFTFSDIIQAEGKRGKDYKNHSSQMEATRCETMEWSQNRNMKILAKGIA